MYHAGNRELQAHFGSTALADRLVERLHRTAFTEADQTFIGNYPSFSWPRPTRRAARIVRSKGARRGSCAPWSRTCSFSRTTTATACSRV